MSEVQRSGVRVVRSHEIDRAMDSKSHRNSDRYRHSLLLHPLVLKLAVCSRAIED